MLSDNNMQFETNDSLEDASFKSCFARSVVVNSQHSKNFSNERQSKKFNNSDKVNEKKNNIISSTPIPARNKNEKMQKDTSLMEHLHNNVNDSIGYPTGSSRIAEVPVENVFSKSQIETLEWQLKQTEASREMYRAVMMQVVKFLERAHHSLRILGLKLNEHSHTFPRSKHELSLPRIQEHDFLDESSFMSSDLSLDYNGTVKSDTWRRSKKLQPSSEEMLPEKLSQEAFMLLRTAESLLNTRAPDLTHANVDKDLKFLTQLSKEFPSVDDRLSQEGDFSATSINNTDVDFNKSRPKDDSSSLSNASSKSIKSDSLNNNKTETKTRTFQVEVEKTEMFSPSSASSAEDESGFSSITSFQDLGIPVTYSILTEETDKLAENALKNRNLCKEPNNPKMKTQKPNLSELKLWNIKQNNSLETVVQSNLNDGKPLKVLWV